MKYFGCDHLYACGSFLRLRIVGHGVKRLWFEHEHVAATWYGGAGASTRLKGRMAQGEQYETRTTATSWWWKSRPPAAGDERCAGVSSRIARG